MNWEAIGAVGEVVGAIAVVVTLIYLSVQLRQNTRASQNASWQAIIRVLGDLDVTEATDPELSSFFEAAERSPDSVSANQYRKFTKIAQARIGALEYAFLANKNGTIDSYFWNALLPYARHLMSMPGYQRFWSEHAHNVYHNDFIGFIETLLNGAIAASGADRAAERAVVIKRGKALAASEAARDLDAVMGFWSEGAIAQLQGSPQFEGKASIRDLMQGLLASFKAFESTTTEVVMAGSGDLAYEYGINRVVLPGNGRDLLAEGKYLVIWQKIDGTWLISAISITDDAATPGPIEAQ